MSKSAKSQLSDRRREERSLLRRIYRNAGLLMGGKATAAIINLAYLAIAARVLGPAGLGTLALIQAYADIGTNLTRFPAGGLLMRYGTRYMENGNRGKLHDIIKFMFCLTAFNIIAGPLLVGASAPFLAGWAGIGEALIWALVVTTMVEAMTGAGSTAILRVFDRFGPVAKQPVIVAVLRLGGVGGILLVEGGLVHFIVLTLVVKAGVGAWLWWLAIGELRRSGWLQGMTPRLRGMTRGHRRIWHFTLVSSVNGTLSILTGAVPMLLVGGMLSAEAAGLLRMARQFTKLLRTPGTFLRASILPELGKLYAREELKTMGAIVLRSTGMALVAGLAVVLVYVVAGQPALRLVAGEEFVAAYWVMLLLALARVFQLVVFPIRSVMTVMGKMGAALRLSLIAAAFYTPVMWFGLQEWGIVGIGVALLFHAALSLLLRIVYVYQLIDRRKREIKEKRARMRA